MGAKGSTGLDIPLVYSSVPIRPDRYTVFEPFRYKNIGLICTSILQNLEQVSLVNNNVYLCTYTYPFRDGSCTYTERNTGK